MRPEYARLLKAIDAYIEKADDELEETLEAEGRAIPKDSVKMVSDMEEEIAAALVAQTKYFVELSTGLEYTAEQPRNVRGHHLFVFVQRTVEQKPL